MDIVKALQAQGAAIRKIVQRLDITQHVAQGIGQIAAWLTDQPPSITDEIDRIPGRRIEFRLSNEIEFDITVDGQQGPPLRFEVSQDGPFVWTHYPMVIWRPSAPDTATTFGQWRPVTSWPLPDQVVDTDIIDLSWQLQDSGAGRLFQSASSGPIFSRPDNLIPLPVPTLFATASVVFFTPFYNNILFNGATPPTDGILHVDLIGYKIVNL